MILEVKVPSPGESITEVQLSNWLVEDGAYVEKDQDIAEIDSDKATLSIAAEAAGVIRLKVSQGKTIEVGSIVATIETAATNGAPSAPASEIHSESRPKDPEVAPSVRDEKAASTPQASAPLNLTPLARKMLHDSGMSESEMLDFLLHYKFGKKDISFVLDQKSGTTAVPVKSASIQSLDSETERTEERKKMSMLRKKLSERLVSVKNETAMLTTFNEVNMTPVMQLRNQFKDQFKTTHNVSLGFMSFFTKAVTEALKLYPQVNAQIDGDEIVTYNYADISIAVSGPKGLVVPVVRNAGSLSLAEIELKIKELALKARDNKLSLDEMSGGTFTITNGGVFGSMLSTPIINPPQSAILGMHNIVERPVAIQGKVEIHPIMYVALSYDHRIIDGRESVGFLVKVKEMLENPLRMLYGARNPEEILLGL